MKLKLQIDCKSWGLPFGVLWLGYWVYDSADMVVTGHSDGIILSFLCFELLITTGDVK